MSTSVTAPHDYVVGPYVDYQRTYADSPRESDRVLIGLVAGLVAGRPGASLLDVGCSSGNLLRHLRRALPDLRLSGSDLFPELLDVCRADPELDGVAFSVMDVRDLPAGAHDVVVVNAVLHRFAHDAFRDCLRGLAGLVAPGGHLVLFDWFHPFAQELEIREVTTAHPEGLSLVVRPYARTAAALAEAGFEAPRFHPFHMPFDLPRPTDPADVGTYTEPGAAGRLSVRGSLLQPWCHVVARRSAG